MFPGKRESVLIVVVVRKPFIEGNRRNETKSEWRALWDLVECQIENVLNLFMKSLWRAVYLIQRQIVVALHVGNAQQLWYMV